MKKIHYYFGWFNDIIPKKIADALDNDIPEKKSLAIITTAPSDYKYTDEMLEFTKNIWFEPAGIMFDEYHSIDHRITKAKAHELIKNASAILLHGGYAVLQNAFLQEYELSDAIQKSNASVIIGASAGGMNMSAKWLTSKYVPTYSARHTSDEIKIYEGLGLDNFALESHALCDSIDVLAGMENTKHNLIPLSQDIDVYVACEESTIRIKNDKFDVMGDVYLISKSKIKKMDENF